MGGKPTAAFYIALGVVVVALIAFAFWRLTSGPAQTSSTGPDIVLPYNKGQTKKELEPTDSGSLDAEKIGLTEKKVEWKASERLPPVPGVSAYTSLAKTNNTVIFAINVWAGWAPIVLANEGFKPGKVWTTSDGKEFKVELRLIDQPFVMRDAYVTGDIHIGWGTLDMLPLFMERFVKKDGTPDDPRIMPRIVQQIDWSNGGDGIVVRKKVGGKDINTVADLKGQKVVLAQNSPSHYFLLNVLLAAGVQPKDVKMDFTATAFQAASAFNNDTSIAACVSWAPDIYKLTPEEKPGEKPKPYKMLITTAQANKLIADVWFTRADFARDNPGHIEALVRGIFDAMIDLQDKDPAKREATKKKVADLMAKGYEIPPDDALGMLGDAHPTNWRENYEFFMNLNNPTNFQRVWETAYMLYSHPQLKIIEHKPVSFDKVMDFTFIEKLGKEEKYSKQKDESLVQFSAKPTAKVLAEGDDRLTARFQIKFAPNNAEPHKKVTRTKTRTVMKDGKEVEETYTAEELYDPNVDETLKQVAQLVGTFGGARVVIEGHTDASMKDRVSPTDLEFLRTDVLQLSKDRADAVKKVLVDRYKIDANRVNTAGRGWDAPADPQNPGDHPKNRRIEVKILTAETEEGS